MAGTTDRWGFTTLGSGDSLQHDGYKFTDADRRLIDRLLAYAVEEHRHTGEGETTDDTPVTGPVLNGADTGGVMPAGQRFYYRHTIVVDGSESAASPTTFIDMPPLVTAPEAPALNYTTGSGGLEPGSYNYVLSAYTGATTLETKATNSAVVTVPGSNPSNEISLILPAVPPGADGFNVYRKGPNAPYYFHLASIANPTPLDVWVDDGALDVDCERSLPRVNATHNTNMVTVTLPEPTPADDGRSFAWRIYRTSDPNQWTRSYLTEVVPEGDPLETPTTFDDIGTSTSVGGPPSQTQAFSAPPKVRLTNLAEVTGYLPPGRLTTPTTITFADAGVVTVGEGAFVWVCPFDNALIEHARAYLGRDRAPAAQAVIVDVNAYRANQATPTWASIFAPDDRPRIEVGETIGEIAYPDEYPLILHAGDMLTVDVDQAGGGATPTDEHLTVNILMYVKHGSDDTSLNW